MPLRILWAITGSGDLIRDILHMMKGVAARPGVRVDVVISKAGRTVLEWYKLWDELMAAFPSATVEKDANLPFVVGPLQTGRYSMLLICPATANTTAKIALGIADTLASNAAAMAIKAGVPVYVFPVDQKPGELTTELPGGRKLTMTVRDVDVENAGRLRRMTGVIVLGQPSDFLAAIEKMG